MRPFHSGIIVLVSAGLLLLGACSKGGQNSDLTGTPTAPSSTQSAPETKPMTEAGMEKSHMAPRKGGQVVESGKYHLELVPEKEGDSIHLDFYILQGDKHETVPNAKVTADIQSPDGKQKTLPFSYDASSKHYVAALGKKATGKYQVKIAATIGSEKVDGRFSFDR